MSEESDQEESKLGKPIGRLTGKTTVHSGKILITDTSVGRTDYLLIYGDKNDEGNRKYFILNIVDIWNDEKGLMASVQVLGDRPQRPFAMGADIYLANEKQITSLLGIYNPPEQSVSLGTLLGYPFNVNLLVKNFGRIFITGKSGSGKSYTMGVLCEEFLRKGIPIVIIDRHGEYGSLKVASEDAEIIEEPPQSGFCPWCGETIPKDLTTCPKCGKEIEAEILTKDEDQAKPKNTKDSGESQFADNIIEFADLTMNKGGDIDLEYLFSLDVKDIVAPHLCTIINLRGLDLEVQEIIAGKLLKKLYNASTGRKIPPFYLLLDEAHLFAGKKQTETCEVVKLFAQEGRKFGANIIIGTQRPQLLDTTIRAQAGTWIVHNLSDVRDIGITISSAEDLSKENKDDISGLDKGEAIICGEAVAGIPIFVKVRKRKTTHGGIGFNPLDFLSAETVDELQKRKERILGGKSSDELQVGKTMFKEMLGPKSTAELIEEISMLKIKVKELEGEIETWKQKYSELQKEGGGGVPLEATDDNIKELQTQINVWKEKYNYLKEMSTEPKTTEITSTVQPSQNNSSEMLSLNNTIIELQAEVKKYKSKYADALILAEKSIAELKKK
ncbi:MAG: helicase HerA domain-containing protein [Promethearchaeota archaeon]